MGWLRRDLSPDCDDQALVALSPDIAQWATVLAADVAVEEAELAPAMAGAFIAGGTARTELFQVDPATPGGFDGGPLMAVFPAVLSAVAAAGQVLGGLAAGTASPDTLRDTIEVWSRIHGRTPEATGDITAVDLRERGIVDVRQHDVRQHDVRQHDVEGCDDRPDPSVSDVVAGLAQVSAVFGQELARAGLPVERVQSITFRAVRRLLVDGNGTREFLRVVTPR